MESHASRKTARTSLVSRGPVGTVGRPALTVRDRILISAGITEEEQARAVRKAWDRKLALLDATRTQYVTFEGKVTDQRILEDNATRLQAAEAIDRLVGVIAPPSKQTVEVVHRLELPEWALPDENPVPTITITALPEEDSMRS